MSFEEMAESAKSRRLADRIQVRRKPGSRRHEGGETWFVAKDVCDILDIANPSMAVAGSMMTRRGSLMLIPLAVRVNANGQQVGPL